MKQSQHQGKLGMVVNYYSRESDGSSRDLLVETTVLSIRFLRWCPDVNSIVVVDGSKERDNKLESACNQLDAEYLHQGREIGYTEAYNIGWKTLKEDYVGLMANDIIPNPPSTITALLDQLQDPEVGCTFPYLNSPRLQTDEVQASGFINRGKITCEPTFMTLNLNLFKRDVLEAIGGVTEDYKVGFADPILLSQIRSMGYRCVLVGGTRAYHYDSLTKFLGVSTLNKEKYQIDLRKWLSEYPELASTRSFHSVNFSVWPFATTTATKLLWIMAYRFPMAGQRRRLMKLVMWAEPWLTRYPAKFGRSRGGNRHKGHAS